DVAQAQKLVAVSCEACSEIYPALPLTLRATSVLLYRSTGLGFTVPPLFEIDHLGPTTSINGDLPPQGGGHVNGGFNQHIAGRCDWGPRRRAGGGGGSGGSANDAQK